MPLDVVLVTGNKGKLNEWQRLAPTDINLTSINLDLDEIQSDSLEAIVIDKAKRAFEIVKKPVIVEDVAAGLDKLSGLPGPFIKFFEIAMGHDALFQLTNGRPETGVATCTIGYYDGENSIAVRADVHGTIVKPRGHNGWGFDRTFQPEGQSKTYGEMSSIEKDKFSHRAKAIPLFMQELRKLSFPAV
jgi:inosine triphosphate pyrophosphatase